MAGKYGSSSVTVSYDDSQGGTLRAITAFVLTLGGVKITADTEVSTAFADAWEKHLPTGISKVDPIKIEGFWDTSATTGPHVVFLTPDTNPNGGTRTLTLTFGDSKSFTVETYLVSYEVIGVVGKLTRFSAEVQPTATATWS